MFYPIDLISHRQRGKFAASWLASTNSEAFFKKLYVSDAIKKMDIAQTCDEILKVIQSSNGKSHEKFSLYLSSHLMHGIAKIHSYQVEYCQKEILKFEQNLKPSVSSKKKQDGFDDFVDIECPDIELPKDFFSTEFLMEDLHILPGEDPHDNFQRVIQDAEIRNFGCLTNEEFEFLLSNDNISREVRKLPTNQERNILEEKTDVTIAEEIHRHASQESPSPVLVNISKRMSKPKGKLSLTPQKRQPQIQPETPTKKRRLSFETAAMPPAEDVAVPFVEDVAVPLVEDTAVPLVEDVAISTHELPVEKTGMLVPPQQTDMELESLHSSYFVIDKCSKKSKIIDQKIVLTDKQLWKWRQNVKIHSKQSDKVDKPIERLTPAINLLKEPSFIKRWNASLRNLFVDHITGPFTSVDDDVASAEFVQSQETMRVEETIIKQNLPENLSTFANTDLATTVEFVDSTVNVMSIPKISHMITSGENISNIEHRQDQEQLPSISNIDESWEDINALLERQPHPLKSISESPAISNGISQPELTSEDILAQLEVFWFSEPCVKFNELVPKDTCTAEDAAVALNILLELHAQGKLILQQSDCFRTLRIWKPGKA